MDFLTIFQEPCKCNKNKQPTRTKHPKRAQQIYQCTFKPDPLFPKANKYLFDANEKFGYNSNFEESFSYTFCSTCNSKIQRYRNADRKDQQTLKENNKVAPSDLSNEKEVVNVVKEKNHKIFSLVSSDTEEGEGIDDIEINDEDSDLEEVKVQIIVKSNTIKVPTAKTLNIEPVSYKKVMEKINLAVQKTLKKKVKSKDYTISYKAVNARGPSNELEDEMDFREFIITVKDDLIKKKKSRSKSSDESGFSSEELQYTKKKKLRAICEEDLSKEERTRSEVISTLCEMYKCNIHATPCFIQDNRHLQLNPARLQLWAREIINEAATYEVPPSYPTFDAKSSVSVNKNNLTAQTQVSQALPATATPIIIQLPSQFYPNSQEQLTSYSSNNTNVLLASPNTLPSIEEIAVNVIKDLSDDQLQKLEVVKIGWQKNVKRAAQRF
ncbi:uncharacterized protein OCT59_020066 [Rhizophagus irregularis]|uniref:uncharacterized protein n=1 Tax=Rhizophagus irregularis TaxID=588596 RepID=UPI00332281DC|nr:hypothetical protein OCT59_020066 [Rhizophagus irregularis]